MKKTATVRPKDQMKSNATEKFTKDSLKNKDNIKDYDRAWEDDRL